MHAWLVSAFALNSETEGAAAELAEARRPRGMSSYSSDCALNVLAGTRWRKSETALLD